MTNTPSVDRERSEYLATFQSYLDGEQQTRQKADEISIGGAAGALALSIGFMEKIAPHPTVASRPILIVGWALMLLSLAVALLNFEFVASGYGRARDELDRAHGTGTKFDVNLVKRRNRWTVLANRSSLLLLFAGSCCLVVFAYLNLGPIPNP